MTIFISIAYMFAGGSVFGWTIELFYRKFFDPENKERKWINPGFLTGPYLPIYGLVLLMLYVLRRTEAYIPIENGFLRKLTLFVLMALCITVLEYFTGLIFIIKLKIMLWDYREYFGNIQGIICPLYSFFWCLLSLFYYFAVDPVVTTAVDYITEHPQMSFFVGLFYGIFLIDLSMSIKNIISISEFAWKHNIVIYIDELREQIKSFRESTRQKAHFFLPMRFTDTMTNSLERYKDFIQKVKPKVITKPANIRIRKKK